MLTIDTQTKTKYAIKFTSDFKKDYKKIKKQGKDIDKLKYVVKKIANGEELELKYRNHRLVDDKKYKDCFECHINPDWLLIYKVVDKEIVLLLCATGSHSDLFNK